MSQALRTYRHVLKAALKTFQGDLPTLSHAFRYARSSFESNRKLSDQAEITSKIQEAEEAVKFFRSQVVQGQWDEKTQKYVVRLSSEHTAASHDIELTPISQDLLTKPEKKDD
eukprot:TRINITY_DN1029_c0_g1_i2.p2 TRINITY_DN1029_c0_g1~~TRINITY_DN1029_c0_g1_i2.p2  ORF type:complete len:113 (+),score=22.73 TRINITY_DN1029_c0_g1_i2:81-419(+)